MQEKVSIFQDKNLNIKEWGKSWKRMN